MKIGMKKIFAVSAVVVLSMSLLAGCGGKSKETKAETETVGETVAEKTELDASTGTIVSFKSNKLTIKTSSSKELEFDITDAVKKGEKDIKTGNSVAVVYSGSVSGTDTTGATVEIVIAMPASDTDTTGTSSSDSKSGQMTGTVEEYTEGGKLVIENNEDGEKYYFSTGNATVSGSEDIEEGDSVTVSYTGDIDGNDLVSATKITLKASGSSTSGTSSSGSAESTAKGQTISGTVTAATMNTVTIKTSSGTTYTFSTMDADIDITGGLENDMDVIIRYTGDLSEGAESVTVTSVKEDK